MADEILDHEKRDVYRLSIDYVGEAIAVAATLAGLHRHSRDQWLRAARSIPLNLAEGNGKRSLKDRSRFFDISRGISKETSDPMKDKLKRIVAILTRLAMRSDGVSESPMCYDGPDIDYEHEHEHRFADHE